MKFSGIILLAILVSGCCTTTEVRLVPQAYMPTPPEILMKSPRELNTIKVIDNKKEKVEPK
jgi:hypothetical protein